MIVYVLKTAVGKMGWLFCFFFRNFIGALIYNDLVVNILKLLS